jgi:hypothetical protein
MPSPSASDRRRHRPFSDDWTSISDLWARVRRTRGSNTPVDGSRISLNGSETITGAAIPTTESTDLAPRDSEPIQYIVFLNDPTHATRSRALALRDHDTLAFSASSTLIRCERVDPNNTRPSPSQRLRMTFPTSDSVTPTHLPVVLMNDFTRDQGRVLDGRYHPLELSPADSGEPGPAVVLHCRPRGEELDTRYFERVDGREGSGDRSSLWQSRRPRLSEGADDHPLRFSSVGGITVVTLDLGNISVV